MIEILNANKPDIVGAAASSLCMLHCLATPIIFLAGAHSAAHAAEAPVWWILIDYIFLAISFLAIDATRKTSTKKVDRSRLVYELDIFVIGHPK